MTLFESQITEELQLLQMNLIVNNFNINTNLNLSIKALGY